MKGGRERDFKKYIKKERERCICKEGWLGRKQNRDGLGRKRHLNTPEEILLLPSFLFPSGTIFVFIRTSILLIYKHSMTFWNRILSNDYCQNFCLNCFSFPSHTFLADGRKTRCIKNLSSARHTKSAIGWFSFLFYSLLTFFVRIFPLIALHPSTLWIISPFSHATKVFSLIIFSHLSHPL